MKMKVTEVGTQRFDVALELMLEGQALLFNEIYFSIRGSSELSVAVCSSKDRPNITQDSASADIERGIHTLDYLRSNSGSFAAIAKDREPKFSLCLDYGTGAVELARLVDNAIVWNTRRPNNR